MFQAVLWVITDLLFYKVLLLTSGNVRSYVKKSVLVVLISAACVVLKGGKRSFQEND